MQICSNICSLRDAPISRPFSVSAGLRNYLVFPIKIPYRLEQTELVLFLVLTFGGSTIQNSGANPLAAATHTIRELVLFKSLYVLSLYGILIHFQHYKHQFSSLFGIQKKLSCYSFIHVIFPAKSFSLNMDQKILLYMEMKYKVNLLLPFFAKMTKTFSVLVLSKQKFQIPKKV